MYDIAIIEEMLQAIVDELKRLNDILEGRI